MEKFKRRVKQRIMLFSGSILIIVLIGVYGFFAAAGSEQGIMADGIVSSFQFGIIFGMGMLALIQIIKLQRVIKDDKKLEMLYNRENDERFKAIRSKAGMPMLIITSLIMLLAGIIAGYFNVIVFYTLVIAGIVQLSIGTIVKLYYMKIM